jgi:hypothetical protein
MSVDHIGRLIKLITAVSNLRQIPGAQTNCFESHVAPMFQHIQNIHNDYISTFKQVSEFIESHMVVKSGDGEGKGNNNSARNILGRADRRLQGRRKKFQDARMEIRVRSTAMLKAVPFREIQRFFLCIQEYFMMQHGHRIYDCPSVLDLFIDISITDPGDPLYDTPSTLIMKKLRDAQTPAGALVYIKDLAKDMEIRYNAIVYHYYHAEAQTHLF